MVNATEQFAQFIELKGIIVKSDGRIILDIPHAVIPADRICACIGPNGAGKTTFLKLIDGLIKPDSGTVNHSSGPIKSSLVFHHTPMIKASARTNMSMVTDSDPSISSIAIDAVMEQIGLSHLANSPAHKLSAGERQKLCLGRVILQKPNLILLDEPTANLDPNTTEQVEEIIRQLALFNKTAGMGALVASLAHELNQPLTAIQLNAEVIDSALIDDGTNSGVTAKEAMRDLMHDNQRAATIIKTLRNMFGSGRKSITPFNLNELVNEVLLICKAKITSNHIALQLMLHSGELTIAGDKSQLQQVLLNLINNAIDAFTNCGTQQKNITVCTRLQGEAAELTVTDNGSGIAPDIAASVFELLRTNKDDGMGIGLWLSRTIVESHQGTISFETNATAGTTFRVMLPITTDDLIY